MGPSSEGGLRSGFVDEKHWTMFRLTELYLHSSNRGPYNAAVELNYSFTSFSLCVYQTSSLKFSFCKNRNSKSFCRTACL